MTNFLLDTFLRLQEWFEVHFPRWRPAHFELEDETDEGLKDIGLEPLKRNFSAVTVSGAKRR